MLPKRIRENLFERASVKTMRYVTALPVRSSVGLVRRVYDMIAEDFFVNGSLSSHSRVPELFAGTWLGGRETVLVSERLDRTTKEAMGATLSYVNDCPYCADMLVSLVHGSGNHRAATSILKETEETIADPRLRKRAVWVRRVTTEGPENAASTPFTAEELPEAIGILFILNYVNRFSHVVMDGSPVGKPFKNSSLRLFGYELRETTEREIIPGRSLDLLPKATIPDDMTWARSNPRIADALARWAAAVDRESKHAISPEVRQLVLDRLESWNGERMPLSRSWVEGEIEGLQGEDYHVAKLILIVSKASYQSDDSLLKGVMGDKPDEQRLIRFLSFAAMSAARRLADHVSRHLNILENGAVPTTGERTPADPNREMAPS
jgi:AhpD family alkylhydroperoxidase